MRCEWQKIKDVRTIQLIIKQLSSYEKIVQLYSKNLTNVSKKLIGSYSGRRNGGNAFK